MNKAAYLFSASLFLALGATAQIPKLEYGLNFAPSVGSVAADNSGNAYVTGYLQDPIFINAGLTLTSNGQGDVYVIKFDPAGNILWAKSFGGLLDDEAYEIKVDASGHVYLVGYFNETVDFDPGAGNFPLTAATGTSDAFVLKLDTNGNFIWAGSMGGSSYESVSGVAIDGSENVFLTGTYFAEMDADPTSGVSLLTEPAGGDLGEAFFIRLNPNGTLNWAKTTEGSETVAGLDVTLGADGIPVFTGTYAELIDVDPGPAVAPLVSTNFATMIFVAKIDEENGSFIWGKSFGVDDTSLNFISSIAADGQNNIYMTGNYGGSGDFDQDAGETLLTNAGDADIFIAKLNPSGNLLWAYGIGDEGEDVTRSIVADNNNGVYLTGSFYDVVDFNPGTGTFNMGTSFDTNIFILKLNGAGSYQWAGSMGGIADYDEGYSIDTDDDGNIYTVGFFSQETDMDPGGCELILDPGALTGYLLKFGTDPAGCVSIDVQPDPVVTCKGSTATFTVAASGINLTYQWIALDVEGDPAGPLTEGSVYSGSKTATLSVNTSGFSLGQVLSFVVEVTGDGHPPLTSNVVELEVSANPKVMPAGRCGGGFVTLKASGAQNGEFRWYTVASGGTPIVGQTGANYTTPAISTTTTYYVSRKLAGCETARTPVIASISIDCEPPPEFVWAKAIGSSGWVTDAYIDPESGDIYAIGILSGGGDFDPGAGSTILNSAGATDTFIAKYNSSGGLVWARKVGGTAQDDSNAITVDKAGNVLIAGYFIGTADFDPGPGNFPLTSAGSWDTFILKLDFNGNFVWAKRLGSTPTLGDIASTIKTDDPGNVYVGGYFTGTVDFDPDAVGVFPVTASGNTDGHILKLDPNGNFVNVTVLRGPGFETIIDLEFDGAGNTYATGYFYDNTDFDPTAGTAIQPGSNDRNAFIWKLNSSNALVWYKVFSTPIANQDAHTIDIDFEGNVILGGTFEGTVDFDPGAANFPLTALDMDAFAVKLDASGSFIWARNIPGTNLGGGYTAVKGTDVYLYGGFFDVVDFDPGAGVFQMSSAGLQDNFISKLDKDGQFRWALQTGGTGSDFTMIIGFDLEGNIYAGGSIGATGDFDPGFPVFDLAPGSGSGSPFLLKLGAPSPFVTVAEEPVSQNACVGGTAVFTVTAVGTPGIMYRWQKFNTTLDFFTNLNDGGGYSGVLTAALSVNTTGNFGAGVYRCQVTSNGDVSATSEEATLTIVTSLPPPPVTNGLLCGPGVVTLRASGSSDGNYRWFTAPTGGSISGQVNDTYVTPSLTVTTTYYVSIVSGTCESPRAAVVATISNCTGNQPPVIATAAPSTNVGNPVTIDLGALISDPDNNIDLTTLKIVVQPKSGANATLTNGQLLVDYTSSLFVGDDELTIEVCDADGSCVQRVITIHVEGADGIVIYNAVSPNGDGKNDVFFLEYIDTIESTKDNHVMIYNRWGDLVFDVEDYNNTTNVFTGQSNSGKELSSGTYFYKIEFTDGKTETATGYLSLKR